MKPIWIIENFTKGEDVDDLIKQIKEQKYELVTIDAKSGFEYNQIPYKNQCIIFYGSIQMCELVRSHLTTCYPVVWLNTNNYNCTQYYPKLKDFLFNDVGEFLTVEKLIQNKWEIYRKYGRDALIFVRPDTGDKTFSGQLLDLQEFDRFWTNAYSCNAKSTDIVYASTPKQITGEWRFIMSKYTGIISQSTYRYQGVSCLIPSAPVGASELCTKIWERGYHPDSVYCIDICQDADGVFWLLEINSWSSAGMYASNKKKLVEEISRIAEMEYQRDITSTD